LECKWNGGLFSVFPHFFLLLEVLLFGGMEKTGELEFEIETANLY